MEVEDGPHQDGNGGVPAEMASEGEGAAAAGTVQVWPTLTLTP